MDEFAWAPQKHSEFKGGNYRGRLFAVGRRPALLDAIISIGNAMKNVFGLFAAAVVGSVFVVGLAAAAGNGSAGGSTRSAPAPVNGYSGGSPRWSAGFGSAGGSVQTSAGNGSAGGSTRSAPAVPVETRVVEMAPPPAPVPDYVPAPAPAPEMRAAAPIEERFRINVPLDMRVIIGDAGGDAGGNYQSGNCQNGNCPPMAAAAPGAGAEPPALFGQLRDARKEMHETQEAARLDHRAYRLGRRAIGDAIKRNAVEASRDAYRAAKQ